MSTETRAGTETVESRARRIVEEFLDASMVPDPVRAVSQPSATSWP